MASLSSKVLSFCEMIAPSAYQFWTSGTGEATRISWQDHADMIYTFRFLDRMSELSSEAATKYMAAIAEAPLYGRPIGDEEANKKIPNAHLTAYILSSASVLEAADLSTMPDAAFEGWDLSGIIDTSKKTPLYPSSWAHHVWRVSHWIGGGTSILFNLARWGKVDGIDLALVQDVLTGTERDLMDHQSDLLRPYKSKLLQTLFRRLYKLKHDPDIADVGGVVHVLWVHHALGRPYRNSRALYDRAARHMMVEAPFMESVPYCLDFDIVQLVRTALPEGEAFPDDIRARAARFVTDTRAYLENIPAEGYTLHKVPGALATMHEAAMIAGAETVEGLEIAPVDIIIEAGWL